MWSILPFFANRKWVSSWLGNKVHHWKCCGMSSSNSLQPPSTIHNATNTTEWVSTLSFIFFNWENKGQVRTLSLCESFFSIHFFCRVYTNIQYIYSFRSHFNKSWKSKRCVNIYSIESSAHMHLWSDKICFQHNKQWITTPAVTSQCVAICLLV